MRITAFAHAEVDVRTLRDLNKVVHWAAVHHVPLDSVVDWQHEVGHGRLFIELTGDGSVPAEFIECGDHVPPAVRFDIIVPTHEHPEYDLKDEYRQAPSNYEEAREEAFDRYGDERMPG